jgi:hypothetical protein
VDTVYPIDSLPAAGIEDDPFYRIVLGDPQLLDTEFDELIESSWGEVPPPPRRPQTDGRPEGPRRSTELGAGAVPDSARPKDGPRRTRTVQRSPPSKG